MSWEESKVVNRNVNDRRRIMTFTGTFCYLISAIEVVPISVEVIEYLKDTYPCRVHKGVLT